MIKLFKPYISPKAIKGVQRVFKSGQLAEGIEVKLFEKELEKVLNKKNIVALNSGTSALELAYELAGIGPGSEVIVPVLTCTATNLPLVRRGAKIIFADISDDLNIYVRDIRKKITEKTKAIVFVHFGGNSRGLKDIIKIGKERNITIIEDAAQSIGSREFGLGDFTCISLQAIKTITSGDGGLLLCKNKEDYSKAKKLRWFGYDREEKQKKGDIDLKLAGYKYHMNNISAAIGRANLKDISKLMKHQEKLAEIYKSYGLFAYNWLAGGLTEDYDGLKKEMAKNGVEIGQHHYPNSKYTIFKKYPAICPMMDIINGHYYFVPFNHSVSLLQAHKIGRIIKKWEDKNYTQKKKLD